MPLYSSNKLYCFRHFISIVCFESALLINVLMVWQSSFFTWSCSSASVAQLFCILNKLLYVVLNFPGNIALECSTNLLNIRPEIKINNTNKYIHD